MLPRLSPAQMQLLGYLSGAALLPYLAHRAFWEHHENEASTLPLRALILVGLLVVYVHRCVKRLRRRTVTPRSWMSFLYLSLFVMIALLLSFTGIYRIVGLYPPAASPEAEAGETLCRDADDCFYFAIITWTTLGYGDFSPSPAARPYAALEGIVGYVFMAFFIPTLIHATTNVPDPDAAPPA